VGDESDEGTFHYVGEEIRPSVSTINQPKYSLEGRKEGRKEGSLAVGIIVCVCLRCSNSSAGMILRAGPI